MGSAFKDLVGLVAEYLFATRRLQRGELVAEVLGVSRDAGKTKDHSFILQQNCATKKPNKYAPPVFHISDEMGAPHDLFKTAR